MRASWWASATGLASIVAVFAVIFVALARDANECGGEAVEQFGPRATAQGVVLTATCLELHEDEMLLTVEVQLLEVEGEVISTEVEAATVGSLGGFAAQEVTQVSSEGDEFVLSLPLANTEAEEPGGYIVVQAFEVETEEGAMAYAGRWEVEVSW